MHPTKKRELYHVFNGNIQNKIVWNCLVTKIRKEKLYIKIGREKHLMLKQGCQHP